MKTLFLLSLLSTNAFAHDHHQEEPQIVYKQKTEIDFEGLEIDGELVKPQGSLLLERQGAKFNPMIKNIISVIKKEGMVVYIIYFM